MVVVYNKFPAIAVALHTVCHEIVGETATDIVTTYSGTAPVNTGFMAGSGYVVTSDGSTYGQIGGTPPGDSYLLPEVGAPPDDLTALAAIAANYAVYQEMGTRFMPPQPAFYPAVDTARAELDIKLAAVEPRLKGIIG